jgi:hypothetical protein
MTGMLTAANILADKAIYDVWLVNEDAEYHEEGIADAGAAAAGLRLVPEQLSRH